MSTTDPTTPDAWRPQNLLATGASDADQLAAALRLLQEQPGFLLDDAIAQLPATPGVYLIGLTEPDAHGYYADLVELGAPLCIGSTVKSLRSRASDYRKKLLLIKDIRIEHVVVKAISLTRAQAVSTEVLLQDACPTPCNKPGPVAGFGPNVQGANRQSRPSAFHTLHPMSGGPRVEAARRRAVEASLVNWVAANSGLVLPLMADPA